MDKLKLILKTMTITLTIITISFYTYYTIKIKPEKLQQQQIAEQEYIQKQNDIMNQKLKEIQQEENQKIQDEQDALKNKLNEIDDHELISITEYSSIEIDNYYYKTPLWVKLGENSYETKIVGEKDLLIRAGTLKKLINAEEALQKENYKIVVFVAYRSYELQEYLRQHYAYVSGNNKDGGYDLVAAPGKSNHQKGTAVDMKIKRVDGIYVGMPSEYLDFSDNSSAIKHKDNEIVKLMQKAMTENGFSTYDREWWHFNDIDAIKYKTKGE